MLLLNFSRISHVKFNLHRDDLWSSVSPVRTDIDVLLVWEEATTHGAAFWIDVSLPQFLLFVRRFITSICSFFCQINETEVQNKIYFDKTFRCWFVWIIESLQQIFGWIIHLKKSRFHAANICSNKLKPNIYPLKCCTSVVLTNCCLFIFIL